MSHRHRSPQSTFVEPDLPIVPMLDMSFQLMAFFLIVFNPTPAEGHMDLSLPKMTGGGAAVASLEVTEEDEVTAVIDADPKTRAISGIRVLTKADATGQALGADSAKLFAFLKDRAAKNGGAAGKLKLEMAGVLSYKFVVKLIDEANRAGYKNVSPTWGDKPKESGK